MFLHATADLRKRFRLADADCAALASPAPINSWYGHINSVHRRPVVVLLHAVTRYTVVFDGRGLKDWNGLHQRWHEALPRVMRADNFSDRIIAAMMPAGELHVGKAIDKKILGTIVEAYKSMNWYEDALDDLDQRSHELNHTPIIGADHGFPHDRMLEFLESRDLS